MKPFPAQDCSTYLKSVGSFLRTMDLRNLRDLRENKISVKILTLISQISRIYF